MYFDTYPVRRDRDKPQQDNLGRLLPSLPTQRIPTPQYQYRTHSLLELQPHASAPLDGKGPLTVKITKPIRLGFGFVNQVFCCQVVKGPKSVLGRELVALAYDSLYIDTGDLRLVRQDDTTPKTSHASTPVSSTLPTSGDRSTKVISDIQNSKPKSSHAGSDDSPKSGNASASNITHTTSTITPASCTASMTTFVSTDLESAASKSMDDTTKSIKNISVTTPKSSRPTSPEASPKAGDESASDVSHTASSATLASSVTSITSSASTLIKSDSPKSSVDELSTETNNVFSLRPTTLDATKYSAIPGISWIELMTNHPVFGKIKTAPRPNPQLQSRSEFVHFAFESEASDYSVLKDLQGDVIPRCYGGYTVNFRERELDEDKNINLILVERIHGNRLNEIPIWEITKVQQELIQKQVVGIMEKLNARGIMLPWVDATQFILQRHSGKLFVVDFTGSNHGNSSVSKYGQDECVQEIFSELGYVSMSE